ncbi:hypothetical protein GCM10018789_60780 [Streptomyces werraensis]|nr:hypothetical protein GCM10018789_60780 [Streptomyces werraensis]
MQHDPGHPPGAPVPEQRPVDERHPKPTATKNRQPHTDTFPPKSHLDLTRAPKGRGERRGPTPTARHPPTHPHRTRRPEIPLTGEATLPSPSRY